VKKAYWIVLFTALVLFLLLGLEYGAGLFQGDPAALLMPTPLPAQSLQPSGKPGPDGSSKTIVYYFHAYQRCSSCLRIEELTHQAITTYFAAPLKNGWLEWRVINVEEKGNEHFIKDYKLYTKSVVLSEVKAGKELRWKNLDKIWELLNDEKLFKTYVRTEILAFRDGAPQ
jgi:hypothetical protein